MLLQTPSEQVKETWRREALRSTWFMGKVIGFHDLSPDLHLRMAQWVEDPTPGARKLGLIPRAHLKTSLWTVADTLRRVTKDPLERILVMNENATNAEDFLHRIKAVPERCQLWQWLFPERMPDFTGRWRQDSIVFPREQEFPEPTVTAIGLGGASTSKHYTHIKFDDLIGKEAAESPAIMQRAIDQYKLAEHLLVRPSLDQIHVYGTRWAPQDLYSWIQDHEAPEHLDRLWLGCYGVDDFGMPRHTGDPIWPERFTVEELERIRQKNGEYLFALQMLNRPIASGVTEFPVEWLCYYTTYEDNHERYIVLERPDGTTRTWKQSDLAIVMTVDPNTTPESRDARTAVVVMGIPPALENEPYDIIVLDAVAKKTSPPEFMQFVKMESDTWTPIVAGIEVVVSQLAFYYWLIENYPDGGWYKLKTDTHTSKLTRIRSMSPYFHQRRVYVMRNMRDLIAEYEAFPQPYTVDLLDALAYGPQVWSVPNSGSVVDEWDELDRRQGNQSGRNEVTGY
jgi:hypothetical protein